MPGAAIKNRPAVDFAWSDFSRVFLFLILNFAIARDYWKQLIDEELDKRKQEKLNKILLRRDSEDSSSSPTRQKRTTITNDLLYLDGLRDRAGAIITTNAKQATINSSKTNYFTTLAMNNIMDRSDNSLGSHLDLFDTSHQEQMVKALSIKKCIKTKLNAAPFDEIIQKVSFRQLTTTMSFLSKTIKEIDKMKEGDTYIKTLYLQLLQSWINHPYLYDTNKDNSEQDFVTKLYGLNATIPQYQVPP
ncbi:hypothetical protein MBANPS3_005774 [Mucor bainieri]